MALHVEFSSHRLFSNNKIEPSDTAVYEDLGDDTYTLTLKKVRKDQAGMYSVKATNPMGNMSASARLKVIRKCQGRQVEVK